MLPQLELPMLKLWNLEIFGYIIGFKTKNLYLYFKVSDWKFEMYNSKIVYSSGY